MRNVLVTGGSRGIGSETVRLFAENGDNVYINFNRSRSTAESLKNSLTDKGFSAKIIQADVSVPDDVRNMFRQIENEVGGVDVLVNNAGIAQTKLFTDITDDDWSKMLASNLSSVFYCCREALPYMIRKHFGRIVNISSMWGQVGGSCEVHYSAAKAGIIGLTKALAKEEGPSGITVNCIAPGVIQTDMTSELSEQDLNMLKDETPTLTLGTPLDIARAVLFIADNSSSFITGQVIGINGGIVI